MNSKYVLIHGKEMVKTYEVSEDGSIYSDAEVISTPLFSDACLSLPMIQKGEYFYITSLGEKKYVEDVIRTDKDEYLIYLDHRVGELIENERTKETLELAIVKSEKIKATLV